MPRRPFFPPGHPAYRFRDDEESWLRDFEMSADPRLADPRFAVQLGLGFTNVEQTLQALFPQTIVKPGGGVRFAKADTPMVKETIKMIEAQLAAERRRRATVDDPEPACPRLIPCNCGGGYGYQPRWGFAPYCARCGCLM